MAYVIFGGLVLLVTLFVPDRLASIFFTSMLGVGVATGLSTRAVAGMAAMPVTLNESFKANLWALVAMLVFAVFSFQVLVKVSPWLFMAFPLFAVAFGVLVLKQALGTGVPLALIITVVNGLVAYLVLWVAARSLLLSWAGAYH